VSILMFDAAYPPQTAPPGAQAVLGYVGGRGLDRDTHVWTLPEWQRFADLRQFPAWACNTEVGPEASGIVAVGLAGSFGWHRNGTRALVGDMETQTDMAWWRRFQATVVREGMVPVCYGSASTVAGNKPSRVFGADWNGDKAIPAGWVAHQFEGNVPFGGTLIDWSALTPEMLRLGGEGKRR
jgi:hypothetical protein